MRAVRKPQVGDKVVFIGPATDMAIWQQRRSTPSVVVAVNQPGVLCVGPDHPQLVWAAADFEVRVVEAASYERVYNFLPGQVWRDTEGDIYFVHQKAEGDYPLVDVAGVDGYSSVDFRGPLTLVFDPAAVTS